jgi:hypothetical protein
MKKTTSSIMESFVDLAAILGVVVVLRIVEIEIF